jgi:LacI family transcriptional regulator
LYCYCTKRRTLAIDAIRALQESGRRVPDDVSVIGFDNMDMAAHLTPALTTVRVHKRAMGSVAVKTLIARAGHPAALPARITLPVELVIRASTGPPAG